MVLSDDKRVIPRYLDFKHPPRIRSILRRVTKIPEKRAGGLLDDVLHNFSYRHRDILESFRQNFDYATRHASIMPEVSETKKLLIGAYFTMEYSIESAALFNPSAVVHPDQENLPPDSVRFLMSLRATGEGHVSSIVFRRGVIGPEGQMAFDPPPRYAYTSRPTPDAKFSKTLFRRKLRELGEGDRLVAGILDEVPESFTLSQLRGALSRFRQTDVPRKIYRDVSREMLWLAQANYSLEFPRDCMPSEIVIFPATHFEQQGVEDLRLVRFVDDDGGVTFYGTYTAFDGTHISSMLLETDDFHHFHISTLSGRYVKNKGMALFPRKVDGYYLMLARHDGENLFLLRSQNLYVWNVSERLQGPKETWELVQLGNCGSPIETEAGWLVLTHGVGAVRQYSIGAILLDKNDPSKVIGRLREPLMTPTPEEREGYVPNVVYSCGSVIHGDQLYIPYAMSDSRTAFATVPVPPLLRRLKESRRRRKRKY
jgi:predicted GH43/DUF377 family glycosyl hydrolase